MAPEFVSEEVFYLSQDIQEAGALSTSAVSNSFVVLDELFNLLKPQFYHH